MILHLQRTGGNIATARFLRTSASALLQRNVIVQRSDDETPVAKAVRTKDVGDAADASKHLEGASDGDKFLLIDILRNQSWVGPLDEYALERIWGSFGENVTALAESHLDVWKDCVNKGAELEKLGPIKHLVTVFELDTRARALSNLRSNDAYVRAEFAKLGMDPDVRVPDEAFIAPPPAELARLQETQGLAKSAVAVIGHMLWMKENIKYGNEKFDPHKKPTLDFDLGDGRSIWSMAHDEWARGESLLGMIANSSPALFVAMGASTPSFERESVPSRLELVANTDPAKNPQAAKQNIQTMLKSVLKNADLASDNLAGTNPRDLLAVHAQLRKGTGPSGIDWSKKLPGWVIDQEVADHQDVLMWKKLALEAAAFAALVVAELATFGGATFLVATGMGLGASAVDALNSQNESAEMKALGGSAVQSSTMLVYKGQVTAAEASAEASAIGLVLNTLAAGVGGMMRAGEAALEAQNARQLAVLQQRYADRIASDAALQKQIDALEKLMKTPGSASKTADELKAVETAVGAPAADATAALPTGPDRLTGGGNAAFGLGVGERGMTIEGAMAKVYKRMSGGIRRLPANFKTLDFFSGGTSTVTVSATGVRTEAIVGATGISEKSLDLLTLTREAKSGEAIKATLQKHIRDLFQFEHYELEGIEVSQLSSRVLNVYVGPGAPSPAQATAIQELTSYASSYGVHMNVMVF